MLTIKTTGDDAWDTDARVIDALTGYHAVVNGDYAEIRGSNDGKILLLPLDIHNNPRGDAYFKDAANIEIEVL